MKSKSFTVFEIIDINGSKELAYNRQEAVGKNKQGYIILERKFITCRISRRKEVTTIITKSW